MFLNILRFFDRRKMRTVRYGELTVTFDVSDGSDFTAQYSIIFYANENGTREYLVNGSHLEYFNKTPYFSQCETW